MDSRTAKSEYHFREYIAHCRVHLGTPTELAQEILDITDEVCPMTFVRVKLKLQGMAPGAPLSVRLRAGEALANVPRSLRQEGHEVLALRETGEGVHVIDVRKKRG